MVGQACYKDIYRVQSQLRCTDTRLEPSVAGDWQASVHHAGTLNRWYGTVY